MLKSNHIGHSPTSSQIPPTVSQCKASSPTASPPSMSPPQLESTQRSIGSAHPRVGMQLFWFTDNSIQVGKGLGLGLRNHQQHGKLGEKHHWARHQKHQWFRSIAPQVAGAETGFCIGTRCLNPSASSTF